MIIATTAVVLLVWAWALRRPAEARKSPRTYADFLARAVDGFAKPFLCVSVPASLLSAYLLLSARDDDTTRRRLQRIEEGARAVYDAMKPFDLNPALAALILVLLYCLAVLAFGGHPRLPRGFVRLRKAFSLFFGLLSAATAFTFFGRGAGEVQLLAAGQLNRLDEMERTYGSELAQAASAAANEEILLAALRAVPDSLEASLKLREELPSKWRELKLDRYDAEKYWRPKRPPVPDLEIPQAAARERAPQPPQPEQQRRREWRSPPVADGAPPDATVRRMRSAINTVRSYRARIGERFEQRLSQLGVQDAAAVRSGIVEAPFGAIKMVLSGLADQYPLLGMLADVLSQAGAEKLDLATERAMAAAAAQAGSVEAPEGAVARVSRDAAREVQLSPIGATPTARALMSSVASERRLLTDGRERLTLWLAGEVGFTLENIDAELAYNERQRKSGASLVEPSSSCMTLLVLMGDCALRARKEYITKLLRGSTPADAAATTQMYLIALEPPPSPLDGAAGLSIHPRELRPGVVIPRRVGIGGYEIPPLHPRAPIHPPVPRVEPPPRVRVRPRLPPVIKSRVAVVHKGYAATAFQAVTKGSAYPIRSAGRGHASSRSQNRGRGSRKEPSESRMSVAGTPGTLVRTQEH